MKPTLKRQNAVVSDTQFKTPAPVKRLPTRPSHSFTKSAKQFMGYQTFFLKDPVTIVFEKQVRIIKCNGNDNLAIREIDAHDYALALHKLQDIKESFTQVEGSWKDIQKPDEALFVKLGKLSRCFDVNGEVVLLDDLPKIFYARFSIVILGIKAKGNELSYMFQLNQLRVSKRSEALLKEDGVNEECMFSSSSDDDDDEEETKGMKQQLKLI